MKNNLSIIFMAICFQIITTHFAYAQAVIPKFNLNFEQNVMDNTVPDNWLRWGYYKLTKNTEIVHGGKYSGHIIADEKGENFGSIAYKIPANYGGTEVTLEGYMKIKEVDGFAGLLVRVDGKNGSLAFDNMQERGIKGTIDWQKYSITLPLSNEAKFIYVAGILSGKGEAWFDDFKVMIDGKDVQTLKEVEKPLTKVEMDKEFDEDSKFRLRKITAQQTDRLYLLGKVWGYVKYTHPEIAAGNINWDYELFRILPSLDAKNFKSEVNKWVKSQGKIKTKGKSVKLKDVKLPAPTNWIKDDAFLSKSLSQTLQNLDEAPKADENYYVDFYQNVGNPNFKSENPYPNMDWEDTGFRLLALYRYWNMIEYYFPYRHLIDENWDEVLKEYIPHIIHANDELSYKKTFIQLIGKIQDTHANLWIRDEKLEQFHGENIAPLEIKFIDEQAVVYKIRGLEETTIKVGDVITAINDVPVSKLVKEKIQFCPASNRPTQLRDVAWRLLRTNDESLTLSVKSVDKTFEESMKTVEYRSFRVRDKHPSHKTLDNDEIGYIYPGSLEKGEIHRIMEKFMDKKGLVIDLRCYPSDFIVFSLGYYLLPKETPFVKFTQGNLQHPGTFSFSEPLKVGKKNKNYFKGKVVILINETTQSQAEYTTMALRTAPNATVIGSTTAGADGNVSRILLPGNLRTMISGIGVYYPDGKETQRIGIVPDVEYHPTVEGIRSGKDELLEKAIEVINE